MPESNRQEGSPQPSVGWYLYGESKSCNGKITRNYFCWTRSETVASRLCRLLAKKYGVDESSLRAVSGNDLDEDERFLIDEELELLHCINDPDPGLYDFPIDQRQVAFYWDALRWADRLVEEAKQAPAASPGSKRKWTQPEVDAEIRKIVEASSSQLQKLAKKIFAGRPGAIEEARRLFGRNQLAGRLKCPSAMISKSTPWKAIAGQLKLSGRTPGTGRGEKVGLEKAVDDAAEANWEQLAAEQKAEEAAEEAARRRRRRA